MWASEATFTNVIPLTCGMGFCSNSCPTRKGGDFFSHTHKTETKRTIKIKNPQKQY